MRITPLDVRKQEFKRGMRGYDADEVRAFLTTLADEYEAVLVDNKQLRERVLEQDEKLAEYRNLERTLRDTLMTAERVAQEARETARKEGELVLAEARQRVQQVLADGRRQLDELRREALAVHREKESFLGRFRSLAEAQIQFVETHRSDFKPFDGRLLDRVDGGTPGPDATAENGDQQVPLGDRDDQAARLSPPPARSDSQQDQWRHYAIESAARKTTAAMAEAAAGPGPEAPALAPPPAAPIENAPPAFPPAADVDLPWSQSVDERLTEQAPRS